MLRQSLSPQSRSLGLVVCVVGLWLAALAALPALAHDGDSHRASVLVLQAIGIIVNRPDGMDEIGRQDQ